MLRKALLALALAGPLAFPTAPGSAQEPSGAWPIQNGFNRQPTRDELRALHEQDVSPGDARELDRLYNELMQTNSGTHHPGIARMR